VAKDTQRLENSSVYITSHLCKISNNSDTYSFNITNSKTNAYNPDINELFQSCAELNTKLNILACILTGIGADGAKGMAKLSTIDVLCIAESEESAVVYGMPKRAKELCSKVQVKSLDEIIKTIIEFGA
ncbi:MAG: chemotaxis protein CheB, partial [Sulfurimonas sp.]|nr:chemotaxis protein CheB [Sulfurimonas sp.]